MKRAPLAADKALVSTAIEARSAAQEHLNAFGHIVTSRLENSIYIKTKGITKIPDNSKSYSWDGGSGSRDIGAVLNEGEIAIGTNVVYAEKIRKIDDFFSHAMLIARSVFPGYIKKAIDDLSRG